MNLSNHIIVKDRSSGTERRPLLFSERQLFGQQFLSFTIKNHLLKIKVIPNAPQTKLLETETGLKLYLKAQPEKGKANQELIKFFKKEYHLRVEIKSGEKSREKILEIL